MNARVAHGIQAAARWLDDKSTDLWGWTVDHELIEPTRWLAWRLTVLTMTLYGWTTRLRCGC